LGKRALDALPEMSHLLLKS
jgi:hypothetical protein